MIIDGPGRHPLSVASSDRGQGSKRRPGRRGAGKTQALQRVGDEPRDGAAAQQGICSAPLVGGASRSFRRGALETRALPPVLEVASSPLRSNTPPCTRVTPRAASFEGPEQGGLAALPLGHSTWQGIWGRKGHCLEFRTRPTGGSVQTPRLCSEAGRTPALLVRCGGDRVVEMGLPAMGHSAPVPGWILSHCVHSHVARRGGDLPVDGPQAGHRVTQLGRRTGPR